MKISPYYSFGDIRLGADENAVVGLLGAPDERRCNKSGELEYRYKTMVIRFSDQGVVEITARPETVTLEGVVVSRYDLASRLRTIDHNSKYLHGFVISSQFGVAIDDDSENDGWISVFVRGHWDDIMHTKPS